MRRYLCASLIALAILLTFTMQCNAYYAYRGGWYGYNDYHHGNDWDDWAAAMSLAILGMGLWMEINRPQPPPPQPYLQPMPEETIRPGYMYYCVYPNGYYPYVKGCPGGWLKEVPLPPQPLR